MLGLKIIEGVKSVGYMPQFRVNFVKIAWCTVYTTWKYGNITCSAAWSDDWYYRIFTFVIFCLFVAVIFFVNPKILEIPKYFVCSSCSFSFRRLLALFFANLEFWKNPPNLSLNYESVFAWPEVRLHTFFLCKFSKSVEFRQYLDSFLKSKIVFLAWWCAYIFYFSRRSLKKRIILWIWGGVKP